VRKKSQQPIGNGYTEEFELARPMAASDLTAAVSASREASETSRRFVALWSSEGGNRGGDELDDFLSDLGNAYVEDGRLRWDPPSDLDPVVANYFSRSIDELNKQIDLDVMRIDDEGNIRPA